MDHYVILYHHSYSLIALHNCLSLILSSPSFSHLVVIAGLRIFAEEEPADLQAFILSKIPLQFNDRPGRCKELSDKSTRDTNWRQPFMLKCWSTCSGFLLGRTDCSIVNFQDIVQPLANLGRLLSISTCKVAMYLDAVLQEPQRLVWHPCWNSQSHSTSSSLI